MKKIIYFISFCIFAGSCQSQKKELQSNKNLTQSPKNGINYLLGSWILTERKYNDNNVTKIYPLHPCERKYTLLFSKENEKSYVTKNYATGKNCEIKSNSGKLLITMSESSFSYFEADLKRNEQYKILSKTSFSLLYNEILEGKVRKIEDVYQRR